MSQLKTKKLKPLLDEVPPGFLVDAAWLVARKIDRKSIYNYAERGWLESVVRGLYRRPFLEGETDAAKSDWKITVLSMQRLMGYDFHVGGKTALGVDGAEHYLRLSGKETVYLYGGDIPSWLQRLPTEHTYEIRTRNLFKDDRYGVESGNADSKPRNDDAGGRWRLITSSPERAILELINELPNRESFHIVDTVFDSLVNLRPKRIQKLLTLCKSVKVKRLFFVFADRHNHAWRKYVKPEQFDLGSGPRALVDDGAMHPTYQISIPEDLMPAPEKESADGP